MGTFPIKYGYQNVGRILEAGQQTDYSAGEVVFVKFPHQDIYTVKAVPSLVFRLPEFKDPLIAVLGNLLDVAVNALLDVPIRFGEVVAVFGQGPVGLFCAQLAKRTAQTVVAVDPHPFKRQAATRFGVDLAVAPAEAIEAIMIASQGRGADVTIEASGAPSALSAAVEATAFEGTVLVLSWYANKPASTFLPPSFTMNRLRMVASQVNVLGSALQPRWDLTRRMRVTWDLLPSLHASEMITHRVPFDSAPEAYRIVDKNPGDVIAVALIYP